MGGGRQRRPSKPSGGRRYTSGDLPAKNGSPESSGPHNGVNAIGYAYSYSSSDDPSHPIHLSTSSVVAFMDPTPSSDPATPVPMYNYDPAIGGLGLGFHNEDEELEEEEDRYESEGKGEGFLSIGGVRVYTEDCSSPDEESGDSMESDSSEEKEEEGESADESSSDDDDDDSEVDDEMVEDYLEGIGGSGEILKSGWLAKKKNLEEQFLESESSSDDDDDDDGDKLGAIDMMNVSQEYGMLKKKKKIKFRKGKGQISSPMVEFGLSAAMDDLMFAKDPRNFSGRRKKKKALAQLSRSWPREGHRSKEHYGASGI